MRRRGPTGGLRAAGYAAFASVVVLAGLGALAIAFRQPLVFPSVGPTVMVMAERPRSASAHPRNVLIGHAVGVAAGWLALVTFGLLHAPPFTTAGLSWPRVGAATLSLVLTAFVLQAVRAPHAPAGATTLIVSLGLLTTVSDFVAIAAAIMFVTVVATGLNLATGARRSLDGGRDVDGAPCPDRTDDRSLTRRVLYH